MATSAFSLAAGRMCTDVIAVLAVLSRVLEQNDWHVWKGMIVTAARCVTGRASRRRSRKEEVPCEIGIALFTSIFQHAFAT